ncbi:MAG: hypothetical protein HFI40_05900 [Lachnospiraceae bacterium]|jgi:hypothetical protein|nr:hypothetical protein [Lachnospiraceae bacterium]MCX4316416.1 hypothetical protein [Lachnospiraceae bacterium]
MKKLNTKKALALLLALTFVMSALASCEKGGDDKETDAKHRQVMKQKVKTRRQETSGVGCYRRRGKFRFGLLGQTNMPTVRMICMQLRKSKKTRMFMSTG